MEKDTGTQDVKTQENGTEAETPKEQTFTQSQVNAMMANRFSKYADYDDLKAKAEKFDKAEEEKKDDLQKAQEKADALQKQLDSMKRAEKIREIRSVVASDTGVPADLLSGEDEETCRKQAEAILKFAKPSYPNVPDSGEDKPSASGGQSVSAQFADWFADALK